MKDCLAGLVGDTGATGRGGKGGGRGGGGLGSTFLGVPRLFPEVLDSISLKPEIKNEKKHHKKNIARLACKLYL